MRCLIVGPPKVLSTFKVTCSQLTFSNNSSTLACFATTRARLPNGTDWNHSNGNVLLANGAWWWSLPQAGIADETLRGVFAVEELHDHLGHYVALRWATTAASQKLLVECLDVRITHIVFAATARLQGHGAWLRLSSW